MADNTHRAATANPRYYRIQRWRGSPSIRGHAANGPWRDAEADGVCEACPAGCCPHTSDRSCSSGAAYGCPSDVPGAPAAERVAHLYSCQGLSTYGIAGIVGVSRQRVTRLLHKAGVAVKPRGAGRGRPALAGRADLDEIMEDLYLRLRLTSTRISELTGVPARTVRDRIRSRGARMRTRGRLNREDRLPVPAGALFEMYVRAGLPAAEVGRNLGVSHRIVLRAAHEEGLPVRIGGPPPRRGPEEIELVQALYADPVVLRALERHGLPEVPSGGPIWQRFPVPARLSHELARELYVDCGLGLTHVELLTGQPAESVRRVLQAAGVQRRPTGGRSPFMRRWRASQAATGPGQVTDHAGEPSAVIGRAHATSGRSAADGTWPVR